MNQGNAYTTTVFSRGYTAESLKLYELAPSAEAAIVAE
jgi:hypothetical protein